jgi:hypothetical protein
MMQLFDEMVAEVRALRSLIAMVPEENVIDKASLEARIRVVVEKAVQNTARNVARIVKTPPKGFSDESEPSGLWWTVDAERAIEELVSIVEFAKVNQ